MNSKTIPDLHTTGQSATPAEDRYSNAPSVLQMGLEAREFLTKNPIPLDLLSGKCTRYFTDEETPGNSAN